MTAASAPARPRDGHPFEARTKRDSLYIAWRCSGVHIRVMHANGRDAGRGLSGICRRDARIDYGTAGSGSRQLAQLILADYLGEDDSLVSPGGAGLGLRPCPDCDTSPGCATCAGAGIALVELTSAKHADEFAVDVLAIAEPNLPLLIRGESIDRWLRAREQRHAPEGALGPQIRPLRPAEEM